MQRYKAWLIQAEMDLKWGVDSLKAKHWAQVCFISQLLGKARPRSRPEEEIIGYRHAFELIHAKHEYAEFCRMD